MVSGGCAVLKRPEDQLEQHARIADAQSAGGVFPKRGHCPLSRESHTSLSEWSIRRGGGALRLLPCVCAYSGLILWTAVILLPTR
jgi:hypothetical protein